MQMVSVATSREHAPRRVRRVWLSAVLPQVALFAVGGASVAAVLVACRAGLPWGLAVVAYVGMVAAVVAIAPTISRTTGRRVQDLVIGARRLADGDLTVRLTVEGDDNVAHLGTALNSVSERMRDALVCVWQGTSELKVRWHEILELTGTMQELAELTSTQAKAVTALSEDVFGNMHTVAAATDQLAATVREIAGHADDASQGALVGSKQAETTATTVRELGLASQQVGNVAALIGTIASQTKLLALNARIEAANAGGDAGSAFAVVAREVKGLAEQTASATQSVGATATEISDGCNRATAAIEAITSTMRRVSENQSSIASAVEQQSGATQEIGRLSAETANGSSEISCNIMELSDLTRRLAFSGSLGRSLAGGLAEIEGTLSQLGSTFVIGDVAEASSQLRQNVEKPVARVVGGVTTIKDSVQGPGLNEFNYLGTWLHSETTELSGASDSYCCIPGETTTLRFIGRTVRFYGVTDARHGLVSLCLDDGDEVLIDEYSPARQQSVLLWQSKGLPAGEHTLRIRATADQNPLAAYNWATIERVEIE